MLENLHNLLKSHPLFAALEGTALDELLGKAAVRHVSPGTILFQQDMPASHFYVIVRGWVKLYRELSNGEHSVLVVSGRGESFAEAAMFDERRYPVTAETVGQAMLLAIPVEALVLRLRQDAGLMLNFMAAMAVQQRQLLGEIEQLKSWSAPQRLAGFLLRLAEPGGSAAGCRLPYAKSLVAARLGMKPETLSRALATLAEIGVRVEKNLVRIDDPIRLRALVAGPG